MCNNLLGMVARQLDLFSGAEISAPADSKVNEVKTDVECWGFNPCPFCELRGLCPSDECGQVLFPIDAPAEDYMSEEEYMSLLRRNDIIPIEDNRLSM